MKKLRIIEKALMVVAALVTMGLIVSSFNFEKNVAKQRELFYQLQAVRTAVNLYKAINKNNPLDLDLLLKEKYSFPGEGIKRQFLEIPFNREGDMLLDPFGKPLKYNRVTGWVSSITSGYEYW